MALPTPVAYWPFDEATGSTAADASGNGHTATLVHGTFDTSALKKFGAAALKNTDGGRGASFSPINLGTVHSIAYWINGWDGANDGVAFGGNGVFDVGYLDATNIAYTIGASNFAFRPHGGMTGSHHIVMVRNGTTTVTFYKDGVSIGAMAMNLGANSALTIDSLSGNTSGALALPATLDDLRLYDVALSAAQVAELYALVPASPPAASVRATQAVVETLSLPTPVARLTQGVVEILGGSFSGLAEGRITQALVETLQAVPPPPDTRVTQALIETLSRVPTTCVTQDVVEILGASASIAVRVTQLAVDVFHTAPRASRTTQLVVEAFVPPVTAARVTQAAVEVFRQRAATTRATQLVVEVFLVPGPCLPGFFPVDDVPAGGFCRAALLP